MASWDDVQRIASAFPEVIERSPHDWRVRDKLFCWERPLRPRDIADLTALGETPPTGEVLAARVPDVGTKDALLAAEPEIYFTIPHFAGYNGILVRLDRIGVPELTELLIEAWLVRAPKKVAREFLAAG